VYLNWTSELNIWAVLNQWTARVNFTEPAQANIYSTVEWHHLQVTRFCSETVGCRAPRFYLTRWDSNSGLSWVGGVVVGALIFSRCYRCTIGVYTKVVSLINIYLSLWDPAMVMVVFVAWSVDPSLNQPLFMSVGSMSWVRPNSPCGLQKGRIYYWCILDFGLLVPIYNW